MKKILYKIFTDSWSWGLIVKQLLKELDTEFFFTKDEKEKDYAVLFLQQITLLKFVSAKDYVKTICRLGGNKTFNGDEMRYKDLMEKVHSIIATNKYLYEIGKRANPRTYLIPNGLDLDEWKPVKPKRGRTKFIAGFVGNVSTPEYRDHKGYDLVIDACKQTGIELISALYGENQIPHEKMQSEFYHKISVLIHPTKSEGCSNTIMEALACGVPVITTRTAGYHGEMLKDSKNVLFCERTVESIVDCINRLKDDKKLFNKLKKESRKFAEQHHDIKSIAEQYKQVFNQCIKDNEKLNQQMLKDQETQVKIRALRSCFIENYGLLKKGEEMQVSLLLAKRLGNEYVEIINEG